MASCCSGETEITCETSAFLPLGGFHVFAKGSGKVETSSSPAHAARPGRRGQSSGRQSKWWTFLEFPPPRSPDVSAVGAALVL